MDNFNKVISFILGLVVVVVFIVVITGKIKINNKPFFALGTPSGGFLSQVIKKTPSPSPSPSPAPKIIKTIELNQTNQTYKNTNNTQTSSYNKYKTTNPTSIPSTGSPTLLLPIFSSIFSLGVFLSRKK